MHLTNYKFEVLAPHAEKAVDIFSNFFVSPLFTSSGTGREVQAVDSENSKNLTADGRRRLQILKDLADPTHYYSKFSTGNSKTLPTDDPDKLDWIRTALLAFHRKHYRPDKMTVVIAGPQSLDVLEEWIVSRYSQISPKDVPEDPQQRIVTEVEQLIEDAAHDAPPYSFQEDAPPYHPAFMPSLQGGTWPVLLVTKPLVSMRKLALMWSLPSDRRTPDGAPTALLSHLLGHEGAGSAFAVLQNHGMLSSLSAGARTTAPDFTLFQVDIGLTEKGEEHWEEVVDVIFAYCRLLQQAATDTDTDIAIAIANETTEHTNNLMAPGGIQDLKRTWGEMCKLNQMFFDQTSPGGPYNYAPAIADRVHSYGTESCLSAGNTLNESEATLPLAEFVHCVQAMVPENCIIERCSGRAYDEIVLKDAATYPDGFGLKREKWYGVEYYLAPLGGIEVASWKGTGSLSNSSIDAEELHLPKPNRYIPRTLELDPALPHEARKGPRIEKPIDPPNLIVDDGNWKLFHRLDDRYALPQSSLHLLIRNMSIQHTKSEDGWVFDAKAALLSSLVAGIFNEAMAQETYDADLAGLHWSLSLGQSGVKLNCFGFADRLPDLALKILADFLSGDFLEAAFFEASRDRIVRGLRTYFESRRADSHAMYYRDSLLASKDNGVDESLQLALGTKFSDVVKHHHSIIEDSRISVDCLFSGNVSAKDATKFFVSAKSKIEGARDTQSKNDGSAIVIPAGSIERQIDPGHEVELHFASKNPEEENGAVLCTYQSAIPAFKGDTLSPQLELQLASSSAIRLLCHILREPLFNELRTKQQLGYVVNSSYEIGYSSQSNEDGHPPLTIPVDFITITVLSRKMAPPEICTRIDDFLQAFRTTLESMPESEIKDHADALSTALLKPIQKLQTEAKGHFSRIQWYSPEVFHIRQHTDCAVSESDLPWDTTQTLASAIRGLTRLDLVNTLDRMVTNPMTRSRVVSCVYGKTFPLPNNAVDVSLKERTSFFPSAPLSFLWNGKTKHGKTVVSNNFHDLLQFRGTLNGFGKRTIHTSSTSPSSIRVGTSTAFIATKTLSSFLQQNRRNVGVLALAGFLGAAAAAVFASQRSKHGSVLRKIS
jgi:insulysin